MFTPLPTPREMAAWDEAAMELGIPPVVLMENASREAFHAMDEAFGPMEGANILVFMGGGNNGGDAAALARHLHDAGACVLAIHSRPLGSYRGMAATHLRIARRCGVQFMAADAWLRRPVGPLPSDCTADCGEPARAPLLAGMALLAAPPDIIVDGLLGTGFHGPLRPREEQLVLAINAFSGKAQIISLDIPSGMDGETGTPSPLAVSADMTITFEAAKTGLVLPPARNHVGRLVVRPIGIPACVRNALPTRFRVLSDETPLLPEAAAVHHKGDAGHVLVIGGSTGLTGAPHLAALAALRSGAGLVTLATPAGLSGEAKGGCPDIMTLPLGDGCTWNPNATASLLEFLPRCDALILGPGMGRSREAGEVIRQVLSAPGRPPTIIDADALHALSSGAVPLDLVSETDMLTPHPGEAARLLGCTTDDVQGDRPAALESLMRLVPASVILKGACTLTGRRGEPVTVSTRIVPNLAVAGSGDVLAGIAGSFVAQGVCPEFAACLSVNLHGKAGELLLKDYPQRGNTASDLAAMLPQVRKEPCHAESQRHHDHSACDCHS